MNSKKKGMIEIGENLEIAIIDIAIIGIVGIALRYTKNPWCLVGLIFLTK